MTNERLITSLQHPLVKHFVKLRSDAAYRYEHQMLVLEGVKPIREVAPWVTKLFFTQAYVDAADSIEADRWEVTEGIVNKISGMTSPEGLVAEVRMPPFASLGPENKVLALDGISDPGNLGTLLRTALALGWEAVYLLPGCCDPFNEKALRAARGAHFKIKLTKGTPEELQQWAVEAGMQSLVADIAGVPPEEVSPSSKRLLVLGNEAHGASPMIHRFCQPVTIPMPGEMESLNVSVAGGILLYLLNSSIGDR